MAILKKEAYKTHCFEHQAMATQFSIKILHDDEEYSQNVAGHCFTVLDELESKLSRFIPDSDIFRINKMEDEDMLLIDTETHECLKIAIDAMRITEGMFDIGMAEATDVFRGFKKGILNTKEYKNALQHVFKEKNRGSLFIDPNEPKVYCIKEGIKIDLGGMGKGFALEQLAKIIEDYKIHTYALNAGESTLLVKNDTDQQPFWNYTLNSLENEVPIELSNASVSASGFYWSDRHIFNPKTGRNDVTPIFERVWVCSDEASYSDAFSTAFFLMSEEKIIEIITNSNHINWVAYSKDGKIKFFENSQHENS